MRENCENSKKIKELALKYSNITDFIKAKGAAWKAAKKLGIVEEIKKHMESKKRKNYTKEDIKKEALKYNTRGEFKKNNQSIYNAAKNLNILDEVCLHMLKPKTRVYTHEELVSIANSCKTKKEFKKQYPGAYTVTCSRGILDQICSHMPEVSNKPWTFQELQEEALKYKYKSEFEKKSNSAYNISIRLGILDKICPHMENFGGTSGIEKELFKLIKNSYPSTKKLKIRENKIFLDKPYIKGFDIDIYIPELNKGIEFYGTYYHSFDVMRKCKRKKQWSDSDIVNYHQIKDIFFLKHSNISILHIKEEDWIKNKQNCVNRCLEFLGEKNG